MRKTNNIFSIIYFSIICISFGFIGLPAAANDTMAVLLDSNRLVLKRDGVLVFWVKFTADNRYQTSAGTTGSWTLEGERFCTVRDANSNADGRGGQSGCGWLPDGKTLEDVWRMTTADGWEATISIEKVAAD